MNINLEEVEVAVRHWLEEPFVYNAQRGICAQISTKITKTLGSDKFIPIVRISSALLVTQFPPFSGDNAYPISGHVAYFHHGSDQTLWRGKQLALRNQLIGVLKSADISIEVLEEYLLIHFIPADE